MKIENIANYSNVSVGSTRSTPEVAVENTSVKPLVNEQTQNNVTKSEENVIDEDLLKKSVDQANKNLQQYNRFIEREVHSVTHAVMYKLVDSTTNEVISEFPPKKIQDMIAKMWELAGLFVDEKA